MQDRLLGRTQSAGLALGAALLAANCAGPTLPSASGPGQRPSLTSIDGANVALASFENSAFPYHGLIPNYQETGQTGPSSTSTTTAGSAIRARAEESIGRTRPIATAACCSPRRNPSIPTGPASSSCSSTATWRRSRAMSSPASRSCASSPIPASTRYWSRRSSRSTRKIRAQDASGRRAASPPSSAKRRRSSASSIRTRAARSTACRWSSSPIAAAICRRSIRSPSAAMRGACAASCCSMRSTASATSS